MTGLSVDRILALIAIVVAILVAIPPIVIAFKQRRSQQGQLPSMYSYGTAKDTRWLIGLAVLAHTSDGEMMFLVYKAPQRKGRGKALVQSLSRALADLLDD